MDDIIQISNEITKKINEIDAIRKEIRARGEAKADSLANYEKAITITLIKLKNGIAYELDGQTIQSPPASIMEKLAKGICWKESQEADKTEAIYKSSIVNLQAVMAQINALQSIFRHLDNA